MTVVSSAPRNASLDGVIAHGTRRVLDERATVDDKPEVNRTETPGGGPLPQGGGWSAPHGQLAGGRDAHGRSCPFGRHRLVAATDGLSDHRRARGQLRRHPGSLPHVSSSRVVWSPRSHACGALFGPTAGSFTAHSWDSRQLVGRKVAVTIGPSAGRSCHQELPCPPRCGDSSAIVCTVAPRPTLHPLKRRRLAPHGSKTCSGRRQQQVTNGDQ